MEHIEIIVGSQMGSAEYVADQLHEALQDQSFSVQIHEQPNYDDMSQGIWLVVTSTYGAGDYPDNLLPFITQLEQASSLDQLNFTVVGLGDKSYDTYNHAAKNCTQLLKSKGAKQILPNLELNVLDEELPEDSALAWLPQFISAIRK